ncbi:hypothetical protein C0J52_10466 [Blattella germanica]|nr:hypothetical protein C0J52_10466 [Blattella germanica]PSN43117.1 hypothetical protein C0J52_10466 [Blattella germanica]PSN43118.1 hypothetical protein C0J52_10466 [Blattella germanica]PSN43119.1 hypothetical protein C0J52_10466 [Blattella germanica]
MDSKLEQRANIKFCVKRRKSATETYEMLKETYRNEAMSRTRSFSYIHVSKMAENCLRMTRDQGV